MIAIRSYGTTLNAVGVDAWIVGEEPAVLIEFDFERDTVARLGLPARHEHA